MCQCFLPVNSGARRSMSNSAVRARSVDNAACHVPNGRWVGCTDLEHAPSHPRRSPSAHRKHVRQPGTSSSVASAPPLRLPQRSHPQKQHPQPQHLRERNLELRGPSESDASAAADQGPSRRILKGTLLLSLLFLVFRCSPLSARSARSRGKRRGRRSHRRSQARHFTARGACVGLLLWLEPQRQFVGARRGARAIPKVATAVMPGPQTLLRPCAVQCCALKFPKPGQFVPGTLGRRRPQGVQEGRLRSEMAWPLRSARREGPVYASVLGASDP